MNPPEPVVVVGAGIAGMTVALALAPRPVCLLSRTRDGSDGATPMAQGGMAAALAPGDSPAAHARDTLVAGGDNDREAVRILTGGAADAVRWLEQLGVAFDRDAAGWQFAREGGHDRARVLHAGGDATGGRIARVLQEQVRRAAHVQWHADADVDALLCRGERVVGVGARKSDGRRESVAGHAVVLATGGIGGLFAATSNPASAQGAGLALGLRAGAAGRDLPLVQFHPTALAAGTTPGNPRLPLLTEALRGAGAVLRDGDGCEVMRGEHPLADLAPRDVVSRRIWRLQQQGRSVFLDASALRVDWEQAFPTVLASCREAGLDPRRQWLPVTPAAHFHMGGLAVDGDGGSDLPGLYAVGEVACNGVHGSNRLASNSLLEGVVFGRRLAQLLREATPSPPGRGRLRHLVRAPSANRAGLDRLRQCLWQGLGPVRDGPGMQRAQERIRALPALAKSWQGRLALELLDAAQHLRVNRGAHFRLDADPAPTRQGAAGKSIPASPYQ